MPRTYETVRERAAIGVTSLFGRQMNANNQPPAVDNNDDDDDDGAIIIVTITIMNRQLTYHEAEIL